MLKQKYFLTDFFILSAEKQPIKSSWRKIEWLQNLRVVVSLQGIAAVATTSIHPSLVEKIEK